MNTLILASNRPGKKCVRIKPMKILPVKPTINYDTFSQVDIRVRTIEKVKDVEGSDKLVRLNVNFGDFTRKILAGIKKERENIAEIVGKQALFVVNLEPKKIMGEASEGMLFDIGYSNEITPVLAVPEKPTSNGATAG